jgi:Zn-dependent protease with chaperone function/uncharacterized tellurite resistance protein B-like protein
LNFFEHQEQAQKATNRLVFLMIIAVLATTVAIYLALVLLMGSPGLWEEELAILIGVGIPVLVGIGSAWRLFQLGRGGGASVAESLGGRPLTSEGADRYERRALNVVEEMALASGTPVPPVYILDEETGINAFAAGYSPEDAVIGLTRGTIETLSRDELQGVVAHEFSHLLHGDMRLNIRLIGIVSGLLLIHGLGSVLLRTSGRTRVRRSKKGDGQTAVLVIGLVLWIIGGIGALFGKLIQASISRQREFLADASAVQYTRNPQGIADALKAIGGHSLGATMLHPAAGEVSHMFFGDGVKSFFATHPPLQERILRIEPNWDGSLPATEKRKIASDEAPRPQRNLAAAHAVNLLTSGEVTPAGAQLAHHMLAAGGFSDVAPLPSRALTEAIEKLGSLTQAHVAHARALRAAIPDPLLEIARSTYGARAVLYALMLEDSGPIRETQLLYLREDAEPGMAQEGARVTALTQDLPRETRLPLVEIALGALRGLTPNQRKEFAKHLQALEQMDGRTSLFEWLVRRLLERQSTNATTRPKMFKAGRYKLKDLAHNCSKVLSAQAYASHREPQAIESAFQAGVEVLAGHVEVQLVDRGACKPDQLDIALLSLDQVLPKAKKELLVACATIAAADGVVGVSEVELVRALAAALSCPMPPLIGTTQPA